MEDLVSRIGCAHVVEAPDMFTALANALEMVRASVPADDLAHATLLKAHAIPYVNYVTGEGSDTHWRIWVDAEMKA
jgi:hypothetical protein